MEILSVKDIRKKYKSNVAVDGLSLSVQKGDIYGILGPNGAGKSTTINSIVGFISPDSGSITFENGISIDKWRKNIGFVPQELAIYEDLTVAENVRFFCSLYGFKGSELTQRTNQAIEFTGLKNEEKKKASELSGGMKRKLNIATAIAHSPKLVIMDEPTVGIDPQSRNHIMSSIKKLNENGTTILYTTHYMEEVEELCNKVVIIDHGKCIVNGSKEEVKNSVIPQQTAHITVKNENTDNNILDALRAVDKVESAAWEGDVISCRFSKNSDVLGKILAVLINEGILIEDVKCETPSLEEVFLSVTGSEVREK